METKETINEKSLENHSCGSAVEDGTLDRRGKAEEEIAVNTVFEGNPEAMKRLVRKIDRCLLPFVVRTTKPYALQPT